MIPQRRGMEIENITLKDLIQKMKSLDDEHIQISDYYKTYEFMLFNNITVYDAKEFIRGLNENDYVSGPIPDDNPNRRYPVWVFKKEGFGFLCYIKVKLINQGRVLILISFHEDEIGKKH